jgi:hypothetical protein
MKTFFGSSWIGWLNIIVMQWLFVRLFYIQEDNGQISGYGILFPIFPLTGWWNGYFPKKYLELLLMMKTGTKNIN